MKAVRILEYGSNEVVQVVEVEIPQPKADEVLVKIRSAGVNPIDWKIRDGVGKRIGLELPILLGGEFAGEVIQVGEAVTNFKIGDEVYGMVKTGGFAEYVAARASDIVLMPIANDFENAAAVPLCALTAWQSIFDLGHLKKGQKIFITGASGAVGSLAVQLAKNVGAYVVGSASGKNEKYAKELGVDEFINYETQEFEKLVKDMDVVFDTVGGEVFEKSYLTLKHGGTLVTSVAFPTPEQKEKFGTEAKRVFCKADANELEQISRLVKSGKLKARISKTFKLEQTKEALALSQSGKANGKIVINIS